MKKIILSFFIVLVVQSLKAQWVALPAISSSNNGTISHIHTDAAGNLYASGWFADNNNISFVAKYNKATATWNSLGNLQATGDIFRTCSDKLGNIYAAGWFTNDSGKRYVAQYNIINNSWGELGGSSNGIAADYGINSLCTDDDGNVMAAGAFTTKNGKYYVATYVKQNNTWEYLGDSTASSVLPNANINALCTDAQGNVYAGGGYKNTGNNSFVLKWTKATNKWSTLGNSSFTNGNILTLCADSLGNVYASGSFSYTDGLPHIFMYNKQLDSWGILGNNFVSDSIASIRSLAVDNKGNVYATGLALNATKKPFTAVYKKSTATWVELGGSNSWMTQKFGRNIAVDNSGLVYVHTRDSVFYIDYNVWGTKLIDFNAVKQNNKVLLQFSTLSELNTQKFDIEKSTNNTNNFTTLKTLEAKGKSTLATNYFATDEQPAKGNNYYRIKMIDVDGSYSYSTIKTVFFEEDAAINIYPNPASNYINISGKTISSIKIFSAEGKLLTQIDKVSLPTTTLNIAAWANGYYSVQLTTQTGEVKTLSFVK